MSRSFLSRWLTRVVALAGVASVALLSPMAAWAGPGFQLDSVHPSISLSAEAPVGIAIDQSSQAIYVAEASRDVEGLQPGQIEQLSPSGTPTASSPFGTGGQDIFASVAVNPVTHDVYAYQVEFATPQGNKGTPKVSVFSSTGVLGASFATANAQAGTLAADASGRLFLPNSISAAVQIFSPSGTLEGSIACGACPGGPFVTPQAVAFGSSGELYVVDSDGAGRVLRFAPSGGTYVYSSTLQSGAGAVAVAADVASGNVFVGDRVNGKYHVVAYDSSGVAFDDFGAGLVSPAQIEDATGQLAVNSITHKLYLSDPEGNNLWLFEPIGSIPAPTASVEAASPVGQVLVTLRGSVDPKAHMLTDCDFEYTDHADFLANGFANADSAPCPALVGESGPVSATVNGLTPGTSYDYRLVVASFGGSGESGTQSFQTLPLLPPEATTGAASSVTKATATLAGTVNPKGGTVSNCRFEYVTEAAFQSGGFAGATLKTCSPTPTGNVANAVTGKVTGLAPGTAYRFRVVVTNNAGTTQAADSSFATPAETCAENPALCPPSEPPLPASPAPVGAAPILAPPAPAPRKPLKCRRGFKKKKVRGKLKCVRVKKRRR